MNHSSSHDSLLCVWTPGRMCGTARQGSVVEIGIEIEGPGAIAFGLGSVAVACVRFGAMVVSASELRIEPDCCAEIGDGQAVLLQGMMRQAAIVIGGKETWIQLERLREVGHRLLMLARFVQRQAAIVQCRGV